jgi:hypothetical protein
VDSPPEVNGSYESAIRISMNSLPIRRQFTHLEVIARPARNNDDLEGSGLLGKQIAIELSRGQRFLLLPRNCHAQTAMFHQRKDMHPCTLFHQSKLLASGAQSPCVAAAEDSRCEFLQALSAPRKRERGEPAVPDYFAGDALSDLVHPVFQPLKVKVTVEVDETRSDRETGAIEYRATSRRGHVPNVGNSIPIR